MKQPAVTVLQLDTHFPRIPGDVACPDTYCDPIEIIRIPRATVAGIVSDRPGDIDIAPFEDAVKAAKGEVIVTSCGFLSYWQTHLAMLTDRPFISSALIGLAELSTRYAPGEVLILTFDDQSLTADHLGAFPDYAAGIIGLPKTMYLHRVISTDSRFLDVPKATDEIADFVADAMRPQHKHLLLECTNLPPYKVALQAVTGLPVTDILTLIEAARPGTIQPDYLSQELSQ